MPSDGNNRRPARTRREDTFLARWSRRKHEAEHGAPVAESEPAAAPVETDTEPAGTDTGTADEATTATVPDIESADTESADAEPIEADLPHPDTLDRNSDFSAYLTKRVSSAFRRAAMRRLFSSPAFNVRDGLDDYDDDYTQFQSLGNTVTAHMRHHTERLRQREQDKAEQAERDAEAERARTAEQSEPEQTAEREPDTAQTTDDQQTEATDNPTPADDAPEPTGTARTATNRDTDDTI